MAKVLRADSRFCDGCGICELVCSLSKTGSVNPLLARLRVHRSRDPGPTRVAICRHCTTPLCQEACPVPGAMYLDMKTGAVVVDPKTCIGCLACLDACPFGAIWLGPGREVLKCDLCGGDPLCVKYCPPRPENSLPSLPFPRQSCLQFVESYRVARRVGKLA